MRKINRAIVHASATPPSMDIGASEIKRWHVNENEWSDIGYHKVIRRNGEVEEGRPIGLPGAHARGHNGDSIGICMIGGIDAGNRKKAAANFTVQQYVALNKLVDDLQGIYGDLLVFGHRDFTDKKACPCFDVQELLGRDGSGKAKNQVTGE